jgi:hypothetical protein
VRALAQKQAQKYSSTKSSRILRVNITENSAYSGCPDVVPNVATFGSTSWTYAYFTKMKPTTKNPNILTLGT